MSAAPIGSGLRVVFIDNHDDPRSTVQYLHDLGKYRVLAHHDLDYGRIVVRPTPGSTDRPTLGLDVLLALGKNPQSVRAERLPAGEVWQAARAWLIGAGITDVVVARVHDLPVDRVHDLAELAGEVGATLWLIWSSPDTDAAKVTVKELTAAGHDLGRMWPHELQTALPPPGPWWTDTPPQWPTLPVADFPTFRAACRRHLSPREFARVNAAYRDSTERTDRWMAGHYRDRYDRTPPALADVAAALVGWLRDEQIGVATDPPSALIALRGTQAALFMHGILLSWRPAALGPDPAARLLGDLTPVAARALTAAGRTDAAAATALSLHLNQAPARFTCLRCDDLADGGPPGGSDHDHSDAHVAIDPASPSGVTEQPCTAPIRLPAYARPLLAAHVAYRRSEGAGHDDPLFVHPSNPTRPPAAGLREAVIRTCRRLNLNPPWLHRDPCKYGADVGLQQRSHGWLIERGLTLSQLDRHLAARLPRPAPERTPGPPR